MIVHELTHFFSRRDGYLVFHPLGLGLYTSHNSIQQAIQHYITQPGFRNNPEAFSVRQREVKGFVEGPEIFEALVYFHTDDYEEEYCVELGLFGNETLANEALSTFVQDNSHLFNIPNLIAEKIVNRCVLDRREWDEGFSVS